MDYSYCTSTEDITKFAIIGVARSGTTWLCDLLRSHPDIICHNELFHQEKIFFSRQLSPRLSKMGFSLGKRDDRPVQFLHEVWKHRTTKCKSIGFKILGDQNEHISRHIIYDSDIRIIILRRKNMLAGFVSLKIAESTNVWWNIQGEQQKTRPDPITINGDEFRQYITEKNDFFDGVTNELRKAGKRFEWLEYEELQNQPLWTNRVFNLLNVQTDVMLHSKLIKLGNYELEHVIRNYAEIKELFPECFYDQ